MVAEIGWDPWVWEEPMVLKPERFLSGGENQIETVEITGRKEIRLCRLEQRRSIEEDLS